jgi:beta-fructofuranosidase
LRLPDKWVWDFWLARHGPDYHLFFLQAPRAIGDAELRHWNVSIGHAVSQDLRNWEILPDALKPSTASNTWDNYTTWTGSVIQHAGLWYLFYTGCCREEGGLIQRIGLATSMNLIDWQKHPNNPLLETDPRWYEVLDLNAWHEQAWRDPWVFKPSGSDIFHVFLTARAKSGPEDGRGVIAHAQSEDLIHWEVMPPVSEAGEYGHLEVPQLVEINERSYLLFTVTREAFSKKRCNDAEQPQLTGTYYLFANQPFGPFRFATQKALFADEIGSTYAGKLVHHSRGKWLFLYTRMFTPAGEFLGEIGDPLEIVVGENGSLSL